MTEEQDCVYCDSGSHSFARCPMMGEHWRWHCERKDKRIAELTVEIKRLTEGWDEARALLAASGRDIRELRADRSLRDSIADGLRIQRQTKELAELEAKNHEAMAVLRLMRHHRLGGDTWDKPIPSDLLDREAGLIGYVSDEDERFEEAAHE